MDLKDQFKQYNPSKCCVKSISIDEAKDLLESNIYPFQRPLQKHWYTTLFNRLTRGIFHAPTIIVCKLYVKYYNNAIDSNKKEDSDMYKMMCDKYKKITKKDFLTIHTDSKGSYLKILIDGQHTCFMMVSNQVKSLASIVYIEYECDDLDALSELFSNINDTRSHTTTEKITAMLYNFSSNYHEIYSKDKKHLDILLLKTLCNAANGLCETNDGISWSSSCEALKTEHIKEHANNYVNLFLKINSDYKRVKGSGDRYTVVNRRPVYAAILTIYLSHQKLSNNIKWESLFNEFFGVLWGIKPEFKIVSTDHISYQLYQIIKNDYTNKGSSSASNDNKLYGMTLYAWKKFIDFKNDGKSLNLIKSLGQAKLSSIPYIVK